MMANVQKMKVIKEETIQTIREDSEEWIHYLKDLKDDDNTPCYKSGRKTGISGLMICLKNITDLYDLQKEYQQEYLLSYRLLQDYVENFFGSLRARGGYNDKPSALQLEIAMKYLLIHTEIRSSENGNCEWVELEDMTILFSSTENQVPSQSLPLVCQEVQGLDIDEDELLDVEIADDSYNTSGKFSPFQEECVKYITGFAVRKVIASFACESCHRH